MIIIAVKIILRLNNFLNLLKKHSSNENDCYSSKKVNGVRYFLEVYFVCYKLQNIMI